MAFVFKLVTPTGIAYEDEIENVSVPTLAGEIMIYEGHAPLISVLASGALEIFKKNDNIVALAVSGGVVEVRHTGDVFVLSDMAVRAENINDKEIKAARERADRLIEQQKESEDIDFARIQAAIDRELVKISVGNQYRKLK